MSQVQHEPITLPDGTTLRATVHRPETTRPAPVVLALTPYPVDAARQEMGESELVARGLAVVVVALRGTGASEGVFVPWARHAEDAHAVVDWCARQPWASGAVVGWGRSYLAQAQLYLASTGHPALRAMHLGVCPGDPVEIIYRGGAVVLGSALGWATAMTRGELMRAAARGEDVTAELEEWEALASDPDAAARTAPLADVPLLARRFPAWREWMTHPASDPWWGQWALPPRHAVPTLFVAGWHDIFRDLTLRQFAEAQHPGSRLVVGPWGHGAPAQAMGEVDYGRAAARGAEQLGAEAVEFLVAHATAPPADTAPADATPADAAPAFGAVTGPRVRVFVMGENTWRDLAEWPPADTVPTPWHLAPGGTLQPDPVHGEAEPSTFVHDPADPVPTIGGPNLFPRGDAARATGPWDQRPLDGRADVLRFVSAPLAADLTVIGDVVAHLCAATDALDADWAAKLVDVHPDGTALPVLDGISRAREVLGELVPPGEVREVAVDLGATAHTFLAGHRLRVDVSSSNFPRFDPNPGTGEGTGVTARSAFRVAHQQVRHDGRHASRIVLPVAP
ncbi:CocE/NonD family hydrolase [Cellulomonas chengniuliangii]|uniref:CocE/NonD family hydrolase n=1 Tax=Cellulomonas chengniuliangii TaxID=2968084 RepID=UPI001D0E61BB|nr:CocE/NonD family hydrolase [Cellulomonas chengniuliangii]MCC2317928.1 CocE/NonD family hydrolase [Cellulomonas chengniuliangii]